MANKDLEGIRARTPKRPDVFYDEPNVNERALRGIAKRTPKREMTVKDEPPKKTRSYSKRAGGGKSASSSTPAPVVGENKKLRGLREAETERAARGKYPPQEVRGRVDLPEAKVDIPASKPSRVSLEGRKTESASAPKKRGRLRRVASAVGRGIGRVFKGKAKPSQAQKKDAGQGKSART